jgi:hypothetical protein
MKNMGAKKAKKHIYPDHSFKKVDILEIYGCTLGSPHSLVAVNPPMSHRVYAPTFLHSTYP